MTRLPLIVAAALALGACAGGADDTQAAKPAEAQATPAQKTVLDAQLKAIQKAKDVQKVVDDQAKATEKAVDDSGG